MISICLIFFKNKHNIITSNSNLSIKINMAIQKEKTQAFTVKFPVSLVEEIDQICASNYITRTSWLIRAAKTLIERERVKSTKELLEKLADKE